MFEFALACLFLFITPGPGVMSAAGVGSAHGARAGLAYVTGLFVGNAVVAALVISGLAAAALAVPWLRAALAVASTAYLLYLAAKIAFAGTKLGFIEPNAPGFVAGFALQPINPKAYVVNTALFSGFAFMPNAPATETALKLLIANGVWVPIHLAWLTAGVMVRRMALPPKVNRAINMAMAAAMVAVVALAVVAQTRG